MKRDIKKLLELWLDMYEHPDSYSIVIGVGDGRTYLYSDDLIKNDLSQCKILDHCYYNMLSKDEIIMATSYIKEKEMIDGFQWLETTWNLRIAFLKKELSDLK